MMDGRTEGRNEGIALGRAEGRTEGIALGRNEGIAWEEPREEARE